MWLLKITVKGRQVGKSRVLFLKLTFVRSIRTANTVFFFNLIVSTEVTGIKAFFFLNGKRGKVHLRLFILKQ